MEDSSILSMEPRTTAQFTVSGTDQSQGLLDTAFEQALQHAAVYDSQQGAQDDPDGLFDGLPATSVERVRETFEHYRENQPLMDAAVRSAMNFLRTPHGAAHVKALQASFESSEPNPLSDSIAMEIQQSSEFDSLRDTAGNKTLKGIGIGASGGAAFYIGALAGGEVIIDWEHDGIINGRAWYGLSVEKAMTLNLGLELSFWNQTPLSGVVKGWLIDLWIPLAGYPGLLCVRYMFIKQREPGATRFTYAASSLQFPVGIVLPSNIGVGPRFWARQYSWSRRKRASLSVVDTTTQLSQITVDTGTSLKVTLKNTSGEEIELRADATMTINMPWFFSQAEVEAMALSLDGWSVTNDGSKITLQLINDTPWDAGDTIEFTITGVRSDGQLSNGETATGNVVVALDTNVPHTIEIRETAELGLVWANFSGSLEWCVDLQSADGFTMVGASEGTLQAYATTGATQIAVTTATDSDQNTWNFGYIFTYTTENGNSVPEVCAVIWKADAPQITGKTRFPGYYVVNEDATSTAYYNSQSNATSLEVTVTLNS